MNRVADIQLENGFTKIANQILDVIQHFQFTQNQFKILMALWRNTYGWNRKECEFSLSYIEKTTYLDRKRASATLQSLIEANVILEIDKGSSTRTKIVQFNKNYEEWTIKKYKGSVISTTSVQSATSGEPTTSSSGDMTTSGSGQSATHKRKYKEILNKDIYAAAVYNAHEEPTGGVPTTESVQLPDQGSVGQIPGNSSKSDYEQIRDYYMQLAGIRGFDVSPLDQQAIHELLSYEIDINKILQWMKECFESYQPKHRHDKINSIRYCLPKILDKHYAEQEVKNIGQQYQRNSRKTSKANDSIIGNQIGRLRRKTV